MAPPRAQQSPMAPAGCPPQPAAPVPIPQIPPIYVHLSQGGGEVHQPAQGRRFPAGGPPQRGRWRRPQVQSQMRPSQAHYQTYPAQQQPQGRSTGQNHPPLQCWSCGMTGHLQRECPMCPWVGPAAQWQGKSDLQKPEGEEQLETMTPILTDRPQKEPITTVMVNDHPHEFTIDTRATYSCVRRSGIGRPLSASQIRTVGFSGKTQIAPLTGPVPLTIGHKTVFAPLLYAADTPINLLGRDVLCLLKAKIKCTPDGIYFDIPKMDDNDPHAPAMMPIVVPPDT